MIQYTMSFHSFVLFALVGVDRRQDLRNAPPRAHLFFHLMGVTNAQSRGRWRYHARGVYYNLAGRPAPFWLLGCSTVDQLLPYGDPKTCVYCLAPTAVPRLTVSSRKTCSSLHGRLAKHVEVYALRVKRWSVWQWQCCRVTQCVVLCYNVSSVRTRTHIIPKLERCVRLSNFLRLLRMSPPPSSRKHSHICTVTSRTCTVGAIATAGMAATWLPSCLYISGKVTYSG